MANVNAEALQALKAGKPQDALRILESAAKPPVKAKGKARTEPIEEAEDSEERDELAEAAEEVRAAAAQVAAEDAEAEDVEDDEAEPIDAVADDDADEDDDEEEDEADDEGVEEANTSSTNAFLTAARRQRQFAARQTQEASRRKIIGATGTTGTVNRKNTHFTSRDGSTIKRRKNTKKTMGFKTVRPGATVTVEALQRQVNKLTRENDTLRQRNGRLAEALNAHRSADLAQDMLRESEVPAALHAGYLRQMINDRLDERGMREFIETKLTEIDAITESVVGRSGVEGAGSSLRESYGGVRGESLDDAFAGLPTK